MFRCGSCRLFTEVEMCPCVSAVNLRSYEVELNHPLFWICPLIVALRMCALQHVRSKGKTFVTKPVSVNAVIPRGAVSRILALWIQIFQIAISSLTLAPQCFPVVCLPNHSHITQVSDSVCVCVCVCVGGTLRSIFQQAGSVWRRGPKLSKVCHRFSLPCHQSYLIALCFSLRALLPRG